MLETTPSVPSGAHAPRRSLRRKHFLIGSGVAFAGLAAVMTVSFTAASGSVTIPTTTSSPSNTLVQTGTLSFIAGMDWESGGTTKTSPAIAAPVGSSGSVTTAGDLAMVKATGTTTEQISVYLSNAAAYSKVVPSFALPVELMCATATSSGSSFASWGTWNAPTTTSTPSYITNAQPSMSWTVQQGPEKYCEVSLGGVGTGLGTAIPGAIYLLKATTTNDKPQFYITATT